MPAPLLAVDGPYVLYRSFYALPDSITGADGHPVNALLGATNLLLRIAADRRPRAIVVCWGAEAADYRVDLYPKYHADRPPVPGGLDWQFEQAPSLFDAFGWSSESTPDLEADDLLGSLASAEVAAGGEALIVTGDRDMYQCAAEQVSVLFLKSGLSGFEEVDPAGVRKRYGIEPALVPDFIALRGDPSDGLPGAPGIGPKTAAELLERHGSLEAAIAGALHERPRVTAALQEHADELRAFKDIATLRTAAVTRPPDRATDLAGGAQAARRYGLNRLADRLKTPTTSRTCRRQRVMMSSLPRRIVLLIGLGLLLLSAVGWSSGAAGGVMSRTHAGQRGQLLRRIPSSRWWRRPPSASHATAPRECSPPCRVGPTACACGGRRRAPGGGAADRWLEVGARSAQPRHRRGLGPGGRRRPGLVSGEHPERLQRHRLERLGHRHGRLVRGAVHRAAGHHGPVMEGRLRERPAQRAGLAQRLRDRLELRSVRPVQPAGDDAALRAAEPAHHPRRQHQGRRQPAGGLVELGRDHRPGHARARRPARSQGSRRHATARLSVPLRHVRRPRLRRQPVDRGAARDVGDADHRAERCHGDVSPLARQGALRGRHRAQRRRAGAPPGRAVVAAQSGALHRAGAGRELRRTGRGEPDAHERAAQRDGQGGPAVPQRASSVAARRVDPRGHRRQRRGDDRREHPNARR